MSSRAVAAGILMRDRVRRRALVARTLRNPLSLAGLALIGLLVLVAALAPVLAPNDPLATNISRRLEAPSRDYLLGTHQLGRDVFSRIIYGSPNSLPGAVPP